MWLKVFSSISVSSDFETDGELLRRRFDFNRTDGVANTQELIKGSVPKRTSITLQYPDKKFLLHKTIETVADGLLEHCLWYFVRDEGLPQIIIIDGGERLDLKDHFKHQLHSQTFTETLKIKQRKFGITHVKFVSSGKKANHSISFCAAGRVVKDEAIQGKIPGLNGSMSDEKGEFSYSGYITGEYLNERVYEQRIGFDIEDRVHDLFEETEISFEDIHEAVFANIKHYLGDQLNEKIKLGRERVDTFVSNKAPRYRSIISRIPEADLTVDPQISDKDLDIKLHRHLYQIEQELLQDGHDIANPREDETHENYKDRLSKYLEVSKDLKESDLASYVTHRRVIIDLLDSVIQKQLNGKFSLEEAVHKLIVPMRVTSRDFEFSNQNLWLLDERLAFHDYLASDTPLSAHPITENGTRKEPDISCLKVFENPMLVSDTHASPLASLTVVEIKRPMRNDIKAGDAENTGTKDPIDQALKYLKALREGTTTYNGRTIPRSMEIPGFIYVLADLTDNMIECCEYHRLIPTADGMGYFGYHDGKNYNAYIQVLSFDGLLVSAKERNKAFFDKLGLPSH
ncbi:hypothetical protein SAMN04488518_11130 [Pseudovibrio ascidiaceicola]|uniref:Uncharacterized protein n=1 Tax=Pseudovibrio ascidiaceicola TaxID=285279 RepID=A0A1I4D8V1_9HYPH|nr:hypothetical protein [Pseudovibrio ascidiaceicola]SFK89545.1 hypothetical protein SAMN04488518_11130 [Pseudovibrio ascidiaceicola]